MPNKEDEAKLGDEEEEEVVEDMITLKNLTEEALLENIKKRFDSNLIYTYVGTILISVNPYQILPIYRAEDIQRYAGGALGSLPPHVFAIGDDTYRAMLDAGNQSILISGESGSGKTEATKLIMQYLASITSKHSRVEQQILDTNPILEAFGNAKTVRNNNSSRFGKYIKIHFDDHGHISGARIQEYLLEKSRIVYQSAGERNYHSFYQLCNGASDEEKAALHLDVPEKFHMLNQGSTTVDGMDDSAEYQASRKALDVLGIPKDEQDAIFRVLAGILHLGNVTFGYPANEDGVEDEERSEVKTKESAEFASELLGVGCEKLQEKLTTRNIKSGMETVTANLKVNQANDGRDALAKAIYSRLFEWLVNRVNECIGADSSQRYIGILDIFGFENFKHNLFEQFCINYANEKLHQHFNQYIFKLEQQVYDSEGINWSKIEFKDNEECVDLIERKSSGMLSMLDEECRVPRGSDAGYVEKMHQKHGKHSYYSKPRIPNPTRFGVRHYAGEVTYDATNCLDKNRDTLYSDLSDLMQSSSLGLLSKLFDPPKSVSVDDDPKDKRQSRSMAGGLRQLTVGAKFKNQLNELMTTMAATQPHYIRCIKPNTNKKPVEFDHDLVETQLRYSGMLDTIRVRRSGYPVRYEFDRFWKRYRLISASVKAEPDLRNSVLQVLDESRGKLSELGVVEDDFQVGKTKVFFRDSAFSSLEVLRRVVLAKSCLVIQKIFRGYQEKKRYKKMKAASIKIQARVRCYQARQRYLELKHSAITGQRIFRGWIRARYYRSLKKAAIWSAKNCRRGIARRRYLVKRNAAILIQSQVKGILKRRKYIAMKIAIVPVQAIVRSSGPRKSYNRMRKAAKRISVIVHRWLWAKHYAERCEAASLTIQKNLRKYLAYKNYHDLKSSAIICQKWRRGTVARRSYLKNIERLHASVKIQTEWRRAFSKKKYYRMRSAICTLQFATRFLLFRQTRAKILIGIGIRERLSLLHSKKILKRIVKLQAFTRMLLQRKKFNVMLHEVRKNVASKAIQSLYRMIRERKRYSRMKLCSITIQSRYRGYQVKRRVKKLKVGCGRIQAAFRGKHDREKFLQMRKNMVLIQAMVKGSLARRRYKRLVRVKPVTSDHAGLKEDMSSYRWEEFVELNFQSQFTGLRSKRRQLDKIELISYTTGSLSNSVLKLRSSLVDDALAALELVLKFTKDSNKAKLTSLALEIVRVGLDSGEMRDELYAQGCKQLTNNPSSVSVKHCLYLLLIFTGAFPPSSKDMLNYLRGFLQTYTKAGSHVSKLDEDYMQSTAKQVHNRLLRISDTGPRTTIPTPTEIVSTCKREPMVLQVKALDSTTELYEVFIDSTTTVGEVLTRVLRDAGLGSKQWGFELVALDRKDNRKFAIKPTEYVMDILKLPIETDDSCAKIKESEREFGDCDFVSLRGDMDIGLTKRLFLKAELVALREGTNVPISALSLMYGYILRSVTSSLHVCGASCEDIENLSALQLQVTYGDYSTDREKSLEIRKQIPSIMIECKEEDEWKRNIVKNWKLSKGKQKETTMLEITNQCAELPLYGVQIFEVVVVFCDLRESVVPPMAYFGVSERGILFIKRESDEDFSHRRFEKENVLASFSLAQIEEWKIEGDGEDSNGKILTVFIRETKDSRVPARKLEILFTADKTETDGEYATSLLESYKGLLSQQASSAKAIRDHLVSDSSLLSFSKGDIIKLTSKDDNSEWWKGTLNEKSGYFPRSCVDLVLDVEQLEMPSQSRKISEQVEEKNELVVARGRGFTVMPYKPVVGAEDENSFDSLAKKYFRDPEEIVGEVAQKASGWGVSLFQSATRFLGVGGWDMVNTFTHDPIHHSLLRFDNESKRMKETLDSQSVTSFCEIMRYMGDYPLELGMTLDSLAQSIVQRGLENPSLYSEIIFQICRQCRNNPREESIVKGWELLVICLGCFAPDAEFVSYFRSGFLYCEDREKKKNQFSVPDSESWAELVQLRLRRTTWNGPRSRVPSTLELAASRERRQVVQRVWLPDGTTRALLVDPASTARESLQSLSKTLGLRNSGGYTLYTTTEGKTSGGQSLRDNDHLLDFVSEYERVSLVRGERGGVSSFGFLFKRKLFLPQYDDMSNPSAVSLQYHQLRQDVLNGLFPCSEEDILVLSAHQLVANVLEEGATRKDEKKYQKLLREKITGSVTNYVPTVALMKKSQGEWIELILKATMDVKSSSSFLAQLMYIKHAKEWDLYGSTIFSVEAEHAVEVLGKSKIGVFKSDSEELTPVWIAINRNGVSILEVNQKQPAVTYAFNQIIQFFHFEMNWVLVIGSLMESKKCSFQTEEAAVISELLESYKAIHLTIEGEENEMK